MALKLLSQNLTPVKILKMCLPICLREVICLFSLTNMLSGPYCTTFVETLELEKLLQTKFPSPGPSTGLFTAECFRPSSWFITNRICRHSIPRSKLPWGIFVSFTLVETAPSGQLPHLCNVTMWYFLFPPGSLTSAFQVFLGYQGRNSNSITIRHHRYVTAILQPLI